MKERVKSLRKFQTDAENRLWHALRGRRFCGYKFRRQRPFGYYIVDFVCLKQRLIIELDGSQHIDNKEYDSVRTKFLEGYGYRVLRFWNDQVFLELDVVLNAIFLALSQVVLPSSGASHHLLPQREKVQNSNLFIMLHDSVQQKQLEVNN